MRLQILLAGLLLTTAALPVAASGGLECSAKDKSTRLSVNAGVTRGLGSPTFNLKGELEVLDKRITEDLRRMTFGDADRPQYWLDAKDLRLILYKEGDSDKPFGSVELELLAKIVREGDFRGTYKLSIRDVSGDSGGEAKTTILRGRITCFVE